jgi:heterodisulfide reductase subunit B
MTSYAIFLGCTIPARQPNYELSARKTFEKLGVDLVDLDGFTCCCPPPIQSINLKSSQAISAYNICLAEEAGFDIVALCNGCFESLAMVNTVLKNNPELKAEVNEVLAKVGKEFKGTIEVKHFIQVLIDEIGLETIKEKIVKQLSSLNKLKCCGGLLKGISDDTALSLAREKLINTSKAGADCIGTLCPFCFVALDIGQVQVKSKFKEVYDMPILHYSELIALALGVDPSDLALRSHKVKIDKVLQKIA